MLGWSCRCGASWLPSATMPRTTVWCCAAPTALCSWRKEQLKASALCPVFCECSWLNAIYLNQYLSRSVFFFLLFLKMDRRLCPWYECCVVMESAFASKALRGPGDILWIFTSIAEDIYEPALLCIFQVSKFVFSCKFQILQGYVSYTFWLIDWLTMIDS